MRVIFKYLLNVYEGVMKQCVECLRMHFSGPHIVCVLMIMPMHVMQMKSLANIL